ncbi:MAG: flagellar motor switch protein FliM [Arcobacter sp.]|jgi:flagellar motor switch protein FliM|uniref:Flagellar motor switch protein FliM n=1 Tax=Arcobacter defluvii TaxID=873191 RepID=A0AAE7BBH8_9BACT|nr:MULTISPECIES: flagellar motor switch protein FliM [Arcobacter]MDY3200408.1 flagellar motor switch protein FliM [Arcobacter sp.]QKF76410.1 flagellar motor switch C-ring protein FliM [Arcobacter defluvii]RXI34560.1 flagellar motor switch protein FliM [Arcobacter defluvii]BAK72211.1 flagellar motor switch protein FliM [Arcobacter sp. L]
MAEFLSQDEIDALLDIAEQGEDIDGTNPLDKVVSKEKNYSIYDFKKPNRITVDQLKAFSTMHDKMLRDFINDLSSMLRKLVDIKLYSIEQMTYGEFILSIPQITSLNTLSIKPLDGRIVVECNPAISHKIIADLLGSGAVNTTDNIDRELTEIEVEILEHFYKMFIKILYKTWSDISSLNFKIESRDTNANAIQIVSDHEIVLLVVLEITIDEESGFLSICYPISYFEPLLNKIVEKIFSEGKNRKSSRKRDIKTLISGARMKIESIMAETELTTQEILNLKENDVIVFNKNATSSSATIYINKKEKFSAISGISNNRKAIQIKSNLDKEKQETLENLRAMREEREIKAKETAENIRKLLNQRNS